MSDEKVERMVGFALGTIYGAFVAYAAFGILQYLPEPLTPPEAAIVTLTTTVVGVGLVAVIYTDP